MSPEQDILAALRALAGADRGVEAGPELEAKLRLAFRAKVRARRRKRLAAWTMAAAALLVAMLFSFERRPRQEKARATPKSAEKVAESVAAVPLDPVVATPVRRARRARTADAREMVTDFFPLMDGAPPMDRGELVRVNLSAAAMRSVGLPVPEDRLSDPVQADVLVSEEGLATAIRFVKYSQ